MSHPIGRAVSMATRRLPTLCCYWKFTPSSRFGFLRNKATMERSQRDNCRPFIEPGTAVRISVLT